MGLDMYLIGEKFHWTDWETPEDNAMEDGFKITETRIQLGYWRKHPNLHGFIVQTFAGGKDECQNINLNADNIRQILQAIAERRLPQTSGFFFGKSDGSDEEIATDTAVFEKALAWLEEKQKMRSKSIIYRASW